MTPQERVTHDKIKRAIQARLGLNDLKICSGCGKSKTIEGFWKRGDSDNPRPLCKECYLPTVKAYRRKHPEFREQQSQKGRIYKLSKEFKLSREQYADLLLKQGGRCAICGSMSAKADEVQFRSELPFYVDHDHDTGKVRGLLCRNCNFGIGSLKDDPNILHAAIQYLEHHGKKRSVALDVSARQAAEELRLGASSKALQTLEIALEQYSDAFCRDFLTRPF